MIAPDKIYIPQHNIEAGTIQELCELIVNGSVEYIRKDALLEWAKEKAELYKGTANIRRSFEMMIRKIESL